MQNSRFFGTATIESDERSVLILSPYIQVTENARSKDIDFTNALIVDLDSLSNNIGQQLISIANTEDASRHKLLIEYLGTKSLSNSERVLHWMQNAGVIMRLPANKVRLTEQNGSIRLDELNKIIRTQMEKQEGDVVDVEQYHREVAEQYNKQLNEDVTQEAPQSTPTQPDVNLYPDFGNPSERGVVEPTPIDEDKVEGLEPLPHETQQAQPMQHEHVDSEAAKRLHGDILSEIDSTAVKVSEAVNTMRQFEDTLSSSAINRMITKLESYGKNTSNEVRDVLIDLLSEHFDHVDSDYISKNLYNAEKRLAKKTDNKDES